MSLWQKILTNNDHFPVGHPEYRRVLLLNSILILLFVTCSFFAMIDWLILDIPLAALVNVISATLSLGAFCYYHKSNNIKVGSAAAVTIFLATSVAFFWVEGSRNYALYWIAVFPPTVYFLLGRKKANAVSIVFGLYILLFLSLNLSRWESDAFTIGAVFNIAAATMILALLIRHFEKSKEDVIQTLAEKNRELERISITDKLTGIYNRLKLDEVIISEISRSARTHSPFSLIIADLDFFKKFNDAYGHQVGDVILVTTARIMRNSCRDIDVVGRWGGEEFMIICPETDSKGVKTLGERVLESILTHDHGQAGVVTISLGAATYRPGDTADTLLKRADDALYAAKANGRGRIEIAQ